MNGSVSDKVLRIHGELRFWWKDLCRLAIALHDPNLDVLTTFVASGDASNHLTHYQMPLRDVPSLMNLVVTRRTRTIDDLAVLSSSTSEHSRRLLAAGYRSSYTVPMFSRGSEFLGFLFFDAKIVGYFTAELTHHLDVYAELIAALVQAELGPIRTLQGAVYTAQHFTSYRDEETGEHLARVAAYSRMLAAGLAGVHGLNDEYVEYLYQFAPLHDIGKVCVPDSILLKPGRLNSAEREVMQTHVTRGLAMIDTMISDFGLNGLEHVQMLRSIVLHHHEYWNGGGYPHGLAGEQIPLAARIVALADCFDALATERPYKPAWELDACFEYVLGQRGVQFDPDCVDMFLASEFAVHAIVERFRRPTVTT